jgi:hypothetical protein
MGKWPSEQHVLTKLVENDNAPIGARVKALKALPHPELNMQRRLVVNTKYRKTPVPARLLAVAILAYAREMQLRKIRKQKKDNAPKSSSTNALGTI